MRSQRISGDHPLVFASQVSQIRRNVSPSASGERGVITGSLIQGQLAIGNELSSSTEQIVWYDKSRRYLLISPMRGCFTSSLVLRGPVLLKKIIHRVCFLGSDPLRVRPSGHSRRSSSVNSCRLLGAVRLEFLVVYRDLVSGAQICSRVQRRRLWLQDTGP